MRSAWVWSAIIVVGAAIPGCWFNRIGETARPGGPLTLPSAHATEGVFLESLILERPVGDRFLDRELWDAALPINSQETRALLSENGLRAGVLAGTLPQRFQTLLESDAETLAGRGLTFAMRKEEVLPTSGPHEQCEMKLLTDLAGERTTVTLNQARCGILVRPEPMPDRRVRVWCEPRIQHGERREWLRPSSDGTGFVKHGEVPLARYPKLAFDAALARNEYLVIGWQADQADTLGAALFGVEANGQPRQRVLVIRARNLNPGNTLEPPTGRRATIAAEAAKPR